MSLFGSGKPNKNSTTEQGQKSPQWKGLPTIAWLVVDFFISIKLKGRKVWIKLL